MTTLFRMFVMLNKNAEKFDVSDFTNYFTIIYMLLERGAFLLSDEIPCQIEFMNFCEEVIKDVIVKYPEKFSGIFKKLTQPLGESIGYFPAQVINIIGQYCFFPISTKDIPLVTERGKASNRPSPTQKRADRHFLKRKPIPSEPAAQKNQRII
jgi:hypothetical protein